MPANGEQIPTVSIGLPVYNGSRFVGDAISSILDQTYRDFELLIQDNASTDRTSEICQTYAAKDRRIHYVRNAHNVGAIPNFNMVFGRARGRYFKWAAHDDLCAPTLLERCVEVLEGDPSLVLCSGRTQLINDDGSPTTYDPKRSCYVTKQGTSVGVIDPDDRAAGAKPARRFWDVLVRTHRTFEIFGVIRSAMLRQTGLHDDYYGSDKVLLAELSLLGPFRVLPEVLIYRRCHPEQSSVLTTVNKGLWIGNGKGGGSWFSHRMRKVVPGYIKVVRKAPMEFDQKLSCYGTIAYRMVAPQTWIKQFLPGRLTET
jgi:glycosyltransferase involved in cell wall biosynthesis